MKKSHRILFITAFPPNRITAGQNYSRQLIEDLTSNNEVDLFYWNYRNHNVELDTETIRLTKELHITPIWKNIFLPILFPFFTKRFSLCELKNINNLASNYDILYFDFSQVFLYSRFINHPNKIGMCHDIICQKYSRHIKYKLFLPWIRMSEKFALSGLSKIFTFSTKDQDILKKCYNVESCVVPFYIDPKIKKIDLNSIAIKNMYVMYGAWNRLENQESIQWVLDNYPEHLPQLNIIGGGMPDHLCNMINTHKNIQYIGFIDNPYTIIAQSKGLIAPLFHGAGVKVKAIESLSLGTPIVGNDITFEGIQKFEYDKQCMLFIKTGSDLIDAVCKLNAISNIEKQVYQKAFEKAYSQQSFRQQLGL